MTIIETHIVPHQIERVRFREYVRQVFSVIPSSKGIRKAIEQKRFLLNGITAHTGSWVSPGQRIDLLEEKHSVHPPYRIDLPVLFEDGHIAVINKPAGIPVNGNQFKTVERALAHNLTPAEGPGCHLRPVHRLDSQTSGLLIIAKTYTALADISKQFQKGEVTKRYRAIVQGKIESAGVINSPVEGRDSVSEYSPVEHIKSLRNDWLTLVDLKPITGRTHQLRRHMAELGHPVVGDRLYGTRGDILTGKGLFLSSVEIEFRHPETEEKLFFSMGEHKKFRSLITREERRWKKFNEED